MVLGPHPRQQEPLTLRPGARLTRRPAPTGAEDPHTSATSPTGPASAPQGCLGARTHTHTHTHTLRSWGMKKDGKMKDAAVLRLETALNNFGAGGRRRA